MSPAGSLLWRKAAIIGSLWAASEIVLGSFLKNSHIPFAGLLLTGIGIAILVAGHRLWPERGLIWRAGLVCAAMKSVSPSAVLLSPMIAIFMEGLLAELAVRLLGGNIAGYLLAGGLAMSWGLLHKIGKLYIFYGPDSLAVYARGLEKLRDLLGSPGGAWEPLAALLGGYFLSGALAAVIGMRAAASGETVLVKARGAEVFNSRGGVPAGSYSAALLVVHLAAVAALMVSGRAPLWLAAALSGAYGLVCAAFYRRAAALVRRRDLWTGLLIASVLSGWLLGDWGSGLRMAARAFALTLGFAAVAQELLNPGVRRALERLAGPVFFETLEYAFGTLPLVLGSLPSGRDMAFRPSTALRTIIARAPCLLGRGRRRVFLITGGHGSGKSTLASDLAGLLRAKGLAAAGILAEGLWEDNKRAGFDLVDLSSGVRTRLCRREPGGSVRAGEFRFFEEGLAAGQDAFTGEKLPGAAAIFLDEAGFLELEGRGWAPQLEELLSEDGPPLVLVVRDYLLEKILARWRIKPAALWKAGEITPGESFAALLAGD